MKLEHPGAEKEVPTEGMLGQLVLVSVPGVGWAPAVVSSAKSQASRRNPRAKHPGTGCGAEGLSEWGSLWDHACQGDPLRREEMLASK